MIRRNFNEGSGSVFAGIKPKEVFGMDDFSQSIIPNADTGHFDTSVSDDIFKQNDPNAANTNGVDIHQTPGIEAKRKLEGSSIALQEGLDSIMEMVYGHDEESFSETGLIEIERVLNGGDLR